MPKFVGDNLGYRVKIRYWRALLLAIFLILFINVVAAKETPFNYTINVRNQTSLLLNDNAICNVTVVTTSPAPLIGNDPVQMDILDNGTRSISINESWTQGNYATQITCRDGGFVGNFFGGFVVGLETPDFRDLSIVGAMLIVAGLFIVLAFRQEDRLLNPLFFFIGNLLIITNFFFASRLTTEAAIQALMLRIYAILIILYGIGVIAYMFIGWFYPFVVQAFVKKKTDADVESDVV